MASDEQQLLKSFDKQARLAQEGLFSVGINVGTTALLYSLYEERDDQLEHFSLEAFNLQEKIEAQGSPTTVLACSDRDVVYDVIRDPLVSSVITIGNGSFSEFWVPRKSHISDRPDRIDWFRLSQATTHLKRGVLAHRTCGHYNRRLSLPLATFVVDDMRKIYGVVGQNVDDRYPDDNAFRQIFRESRVTIGTLRKLGTQRFKSKTQH